MITISDESAKLISGYLSAYGVLTEKVLLREPDNSTRVVVLQNTIHELVKLIEELKQGDSTTKS